jgi:hypothetical protein
VARGIDASQFSAGPQLAISMRQLRTGNNSGFLARQPRAGMTEQGKQLDRGIVPPISREEAPAMAFSSCTSRSSSAQPQNAAQDFVRMFTEERRAA